MTDTSSAPPSSPTTPTAPTAPTPSNYEVTINQNPTNTPNPLGPQAPDAPTGDVKGSEHRPQSRREAIQAAFDRANNPQAAKEKTEAKPAKPADAKKGHNQPPEDTPTEKFDLKKRPGEQPRSERGTFAPRATNEARNVAPGEQTDNGAKPDQRLRSAPLPDHAPYREPPPRFSEPGKAEWAAAPESVRADVYRMHREFDGAYQQYRGAAEAFMPVAKYHAMAQQHGTTLEKALESYTGIEMKLRADPVAGLDNIVYNLGLTDPETGRRLNLRDIAYHVLSQTPEQLKQLQQGNQQSAAQQQIGALHREVTGLKQHLHQMHTAQQFSYTRSQVDQFASQHPRFDELGPLIENELKLGFDLETAYRRAELLHPATHAAQTRTASAQTRPTNIDRSISGAPEAGPSNGQSRPKGPPPSRREAVQNAIRRVQGSM